jgi:hypothetical protein
MPTFDLRDFPADFGEAPRLIVSDVARLLFDRIGYPPLKSEVIAIFWERWRECLQPMYRSDLPYEAIRLTTDVFRPEQLAYQIAHELGHLSARADFRFVRTDGLNWIEEMLCEAHSLVALERLAGEGRFDWAASYLRIVLDETLGIQVDHGWYRTNAETLRTARRLTRDCQAISRHVFERVPPQRIISDNRLLLCLPVGPPLHDFLGHWDELSGQGENVPKTLRALVTPVSV